MNDLTSIQVGRGWLTGMMLRLFGFRKHAVRLTPSGVQLLGGSMRDLTFGELSQPLEVKSRVGFSCIDVVTKDDDRLNVVGLRRADALSFIEAANSRWRKHFRLQVAIEHELKELQVQAFIIFVSAHQVPDQVLCGA